MKTKIAGCVATGLCFLALAWVFFPVSVEADHQTFMPLTADEFAQVRAEAIDAEASLRLKGIELIAGDPASHSIQFDCKGVPVLTLINGPIVLSVLTMVDADQRAPDVVSFRGRLYPRFKESWEQPVKGAVPTRPNVVEAFVLKHREGMNMAADCSSIL
ncbi:hypothetical protein IEQ11_23570 [Lysobacter capsici]|uniref:hypothetical protein n=1 Tax=Lysobacter capsici TaxID=435897 RepID=UPI00177B1583|nr:hypothetical protein [Lysobacter capsici]UOF14655.1 hypothetical protein IEQ11_23570 [Lysobacter capsici]